MFVALWPGETTRTRLAAERDRWRWSSAARPTPDAKLHATLHFIGRVERARLETVALGLFVPFAPFRLALGGHALWKNGIAALEPNVTPDRLATLHRALGSALTAMDLPVETRPFRPHLTLAREALRSTPPAEDAGIEWRVNGYALVESRLDGVYEVLATYPPGRARIGRIRSSPASAGACTAGRTRRP